MKVDLSFWAIIPYTELITYIIDNTVYKPVSYRFLCFAIIIVKESNMLVEYELNEGLKEFANKEDKKNRKDK